MDVIGSPTIVKMADVLLLHIASPKCNTKALVPFALSIILSANILHYLKSTRDLLV